MNGEAALAPPPDSGRKDAQAERPFSRVRQDSWSGWGGTSGCGSHGRRQAIPGRGPRDRRVLNRLAEQKRRMFRSATSAA